MKSLDEYKKEIEQDPKARRRLKKLEKEFEAVEESLTDEELVKYGLKQAEPDAHDDQTSDEAGAQDYQTSNKPDAMDSEASSVIDLISRKI